MMQQFEIMKITPELSTKYAAEPSRPHRHSYEEIIIISKGSAQHFIDFNKEAISPPVMIYVAQGKIHQFLPEPDAEGWAIRYNTEFIPQSRFHYYSDFSDNINYKLETAGCLQKLETLCEMMLDETKQPQPDLNVIKHLLLALLAKSESEGKQRFEQENPAANTQLIAFNSFLKIVEDNYKRPEGVEFYAEKMNMSARNLNLICKSVLDKSVSEIVETRRLIEARKLLLNTAMSVSEVGYELGYNEKSYFTRVFTQKIGLTPTHFRNRMAQLIS